MQSMFLKRGNLALTVPPYTDTRTHHLAPTGNQVIDLTGPKFKGVAFLRVDSLEAPVWVKLGPPGASLVVAEPSEVTDGSAPLAVAAGGFEMFNIQHLEGPLGLALLSSGRVQVSYWSADVSG